jgi:hypothetical protein
VKALGYTICAVACPRRKSVRLLSVFATGVLAAVALGGCGAGSSPAPNPAAAVPANAPLYIAFQVDQEGALARATRSDAMRIAGISRPYSFLYRLLSLRGGSVRRSSVLSFMGPQAGLFVEATPQLEAAASSPATLIGFARTILEGGLAHLTGAALPSALILDVTNSAAARAFIRNQSAGLHARTLPFAGVKMTILDNGRAAALTRSLLLVGNTAGVRAALATIGGAPALRFAQPFAAMRAAAPSGAVAVAYLHLPSNAHALEGDEGEASSSSTQTTTRTTAKPGSPIAARGVTRSSVQRAGQRDAAKSAPAARARGNAAGAPAKARSQGGASGYLRELIGPPGSALYLSLLPRPGSLRLVIDRLVGESPDPPSTSESEQLQDTQQLFSALPESSWIALALENLPDALHKALALAPALSALLGGSAGEQESAEPLGSAGAGGQTSALQKGANASAPGAAVQRLLGMLSRLGGSSLGSLITPVGQIVSALDANPHALEQALAGWMGPAALFLSGASLLEINGALVIDSHDEARSREAVAQLGAIFRGAHLAVRALSASGAQSAIDVTVAGLPGGLQIAAGNGKLVAGFGSAPITEALSPSATLGSSTSYRDAQDALAEGLSPRLLISFPQLTAILGLLGANSSPALAQILPHLYSLSSLVVGVGRVGQEQRTAIVLTLAP